MKTNVQIKDEPVELQVNETVNELLRLYGYNLTSQPSTKTFKTIVNQEQEPSTCAWCQKLGIRSFTLRTDNGDSKTLCSEVCFNQYRRASFKKNKGSESEFEHNISTKSHQLDRNLTIKNKSPNSSVVPKKNLSKREHNSHHQLIDTNRRKVLLPFRRSTPTIAKTKTNELPRTISPSLPPSKRHRSSSSSSSSNEKILHVDQSPSTSTNLPVSLTWPRSFFLPSSIPWPPPVDINRFQYPIFAPPPPPPPPPAPLPLPLPATLPITSSDHSPSTLFTTLTKGTLANFTCILPTFIPLPIPIPIPLCFPVHLPCLKCSTEVTNQECQTVTENDIHQKRKRRMSI